jgi:DNA-binding XRE family transcriptional regulator
MHAMLSNDLHELRKEEYQHLLDSLATNIKYLRKRNDITMEELAERSGLSIHGLKSIEAGKVEPNLYDLYCIAKGLETSLMVLVAG